ncbi:MAG TPA: VWA domain-containing protein [Methylomirabilota bacterium]|nr:VWA domain-containing protein [Methylomirabilota bacterium]
MRTLNQKGSVVIFLTLTFALLGTFIGFALDFGRAYLEKARISRLVDGAALAAAKVLKGQVGLEDAATRAACDSMVMNGAAVVMSGNGCAATGSEFTVAVNFVPKVVGGGLPIQYVQVQGNEPVQTTFLRFLAFLTSGDFSTINVSALAEAGPERPIDLMIVLDRSGSMSTVDGSGNTKIFALKTATTTFLDNNFTSDDHIGMTSFAYRGCSGTAAGDFTGADCTTAPDKPIGSSISSIKTAVNNLNPQNGSTNTMEGLRVANAQITTAINDPTRSSTRKAVLLITDGRPTSTRLFTDTTCKKDPIDGTNLSAGVTPTPITGTFPNGCIQSVITSANNYMYWNPLTSFNVNNQISNPSGPLRFQHTVRNARVTAMSEADTIRNLAGKSVVIYVIAIGKIDSSAPGNSLDDNAKCLLGRIANDPNTISTNCPNVFTTSDNDTYPDLLPCKADPNSCIDNTQQKGRMFTIDLNGNVQQQLDDVFNEVALLLKLRLTI